MTNNTTGQLCYIAGPISGTTDYVERFAATQAKLEELGYSVVNPQLVNSNLPKGTPYESIMKMGFQMVDICDTVYMMKDWEKSKGAIRERAYAIAKQKFIIYDSEGVTDTEVIDTTDNKH